MVDVAEGHSPEAGVERLEDAQQRLGPRVGQEESGRYRVREEPVVHLGRSHVRGLALVPWHPEPPGLKKIHHRMGDGPLGEAPRGAEDLAELVGPDRSEGHLGIAGLIAGPVQPKSSVAEELLRLLSREEVGNRVGLGDDQRPDLAVCLIDVPQAP